MIVAKEESRFSISFFFMSNFGQRDHPELVAP